MPKYVAFLRAINVGGHTVKMDYLRSLFAALGFAKVETFIASGNVIFESKTKNTAALERKIEKHLRNVLGYEVTTFVRSISEVAEVARYKPFSDSDMNADGSTVYVGFVAQEPGEQAKQKLLSLATADDDFHFFGREVYWLRRRTSETEFTGALSEKILGVRTTVRNANTIRRIAAKYS